MHLKYPRTPAAIQKLSADSEQGVELTPMDPEDMWHAYNLIQVGDVVKANAIRKLSCDSSTGSAAVSKIQTRLTVQVLYIFFDPQTSELKLDGVVKAEDPPVDAMGRRHTLDLEPHRSFWLWKKLGWDSVSVQQLRNALQDDVGNAIAAVIMQEGLANVCLITNNRTVLRQLVEVSIPKKRSAVKEQDSGMRKFYAQVQTAVLAHFAWDKPRTLLLASPGFVADGFRKYMSEQAARTADKTLARVAKDAVVIHASTGHLHSLNEVMHSREVQALAQNRKFRQESVLMDNFFNHLRKDDGRAWYGLEPVKKAVGEGAVGKGGGVLLLSNDLFRSTDIATRKLYVGLHDKVKADGGEVVILSGDHESGQRLEGLGGIAATLTYPIFDLDEDPEEAGGQGEGDEGEAII